mgnify:CR=1 FL=1
MSIFEVVFTVYLSIALLFLIGGGVMAYCVITMESAARAAARPLPPQPPLPPQL